MATKKTGTTAEEQALFDYLYAGDKFLEQDAPSYESGAPISYEELNPYEQLTGTEYGNITSDPRYKNAELDALRAFEDQAENGFTDRDLADQARSDADVNRQYRGRMGAINQNMATRGISGSGLDLVQQQMAAQDATEMQALAALERNAEQAERRTQGSAQAASLAGNMSAEEYKRAADAAAAQDAINRFNTQNSVDRQTQNNAIQNNATQQNWNRTNETTDKNVDAAYQNSKDKLGVSQGNAQQQYNYATDQYNRGAAQKAAKDAKRSGTGAAIGGAVGAVGGAFFGGPAGAAVGGSVGSALGGMFAHGGTVEGPEMAEGDHAANDVVPIVASAGEIVVPKSHARDPMQAAKFVAEQNGEELDPVGLLLEAMQLMRKK